MFACIYSLERQSKADTSAQKKVKDQSIDGSRPNSIWNLCTLIAQGIL